MRSDYDDLEPLDAEIFNKIEWLPKPTYNRSSNFGGPQLAGPLTEVPVTETSLNKNIEHLNTNDIDKTWHYLTRKINGIMKEKYKKTKNTPITENLNEHERNKIKNLEQTRKNEQVIALVSFLFS